LRRQTRNTAFLRCIKPLGSGAPSLEATSTTETYRCRIFDMISLRGHIVVGLARRLINDSLGKFVRVAGALGLLGRCLIGHAGKYGILTA